MVEVLTRAVPATQRKSPPQADPPLAETTDYTDYTDKAAGKNLVEHLLISDIRAIRG